MVSRNSSFRDHAIATGLLVPVRVLFVALLAAIAMLTAAWIVDWIWVFRVWPDGIGRLESILEADLATALDLAKRQGHSPAFVSDAANALYDTVFGLSGVHDMAQRFAVDRPLSMPDSIVRNFFVSNEDAIRAAMVGTQLLGVRLATAVLFAPLLTVAFVCGVADGLVERAIRRACGGRESSSLYHRAKYLQWVATGLCLLVALLWPAPIDRWWVVLTYSAALALLSRIRWAYYKKHL